MALIHRAEIAPTKIELLRAWVPAQAWSSTVDTSTLDVIDAYRFDDPDDVVGIETHLLRAADGAVLHVPVTYRPAPLDDAVLITTMAHSVLGTRYVYDGTTDPVYQRELLRTILTGGRQADLEFDAPVPDERRVVRTEVRGSGLPADGALPTADFVTTEVLRIVGTGAVPTDPETFTLTGTWPGQDRPALLATARAN